MFTQERQAADRVARRPRNRADDRSQPRRAARGPSAPRAGDTAAGAKFTVRLPVAAEEPAAIALAFGERTRSRRAARRILVVDDNEDALELLAEVLRDAGHVVTTAKDGPTALEAMKTFHADVAILDIGLPVMDGYELAGRLRAELGEATPRLIALTGYGQESDRAARQAGGFCRASDQAGRRRPTARSAGGGTPLLNMQVWEPEALRAAQCIVCGGSGFGAAAPGER